jgi:hypothetical protein
MSDESAEPPTVAAVLGRTARSLRGDRKAELVARAARLAGLNWGTGRIADLEAGRVSPTLPTLIALCWAFRDLLGRPVELPDLFVGDGDVTLSPDVIVPLEVLRAALDGRGLADPPGGLLPVRLISDAVERSLLEADYRMAHSVGIAPELAAATMQELWGRSFTAERDRRAGPDANPQKRGRVSRELKTELHEAVNDGDD